jgi:hypothetical protein
MHGNCCTGAFQPGGLQAPAGMWLWWLAGVVAGGWWLCGCVAVCWLGVVSCFTWFTAPCFGFRLSRVLAVGRKKAVCHLMFKV